VRIEEISHGFTPSDSAISSGSSSKSGAIVIFPRRAPGVRARSSPL
jgi:hypothetical protein